MVAILANGAARRCWFISRTTTSVADDQQAPVRAPPPMRRLQDLADRLGLTTARTDSGSLGRDYRRRCPGTRAEVAEGELPEFGRAIAHRVAWRKRPLSIQC